jgi:hypothetical protein
VYIDCGKLALCMLGSVCKCTAQGCSVDLQAGVTFDMQLQLPDGNGSVAGLGGSIHNVYFTHP